jgi:hypothetical protein
MVFENILRISNTKTERFRICNLRLILLGRLKIEFTRMRRVLLVTPTREIRNAYNNFVEKPQEKRSLGRRRRSLEVKGGLACAQLSTLP